MEQFDWPGTATLDTASIRSRAAEAAERSRRIAEASMPAVLAQRGHVVGAPTPPPEPELAPTTAAPATDPIPAPLPPEPVMSTAALRVVEPVDQLPSQPVTNGSVAAPADQLPSQPVTNGSVAAPADQLPSRPVTNGSVAAPADPSLFTFDPLGPSKDPVRTQDGHLGRPGQPIEPARVETGFTMSDAAAGAHPVDEVMVESNVSTDGFRASDLRTILEWLAVIGSALAVALLIKAFVLQAFWIPSESMETTVNAGDRILVNKVSYRLHDVRRGDLVVFSKIEGTAGEDDLIKRAIALPGETIEVRDDGRIWIWGPGEGPEDALLLDEPYLDPQNRRIPAPSSSTPLSQDIWHEGCTNTRTPGRCTLDDSSFFMLGDNRTRSSDSRFFGPVPEDNVVGRAFVRIWPLGDISTL